MRDWIEIDGSYGEGGGQVLRTSLTLSVLTGRSLRVEHIRAGRNKPGLRPQHLTAVRAAAAICGAQLEGDEIGSRDLSFIPSGPARAGQYTFDVTEAAQGGSAGSVGLVLQTIFLPLALTDGESHVTLRGGTHVPWAPSISYVEHVFLPQLARMGAQAQIELEQWGFYPAGGGHVQVRISGRAGDLCPLQLAERGACQSAWGIAAAMNLPSHIPQRMADRARGLLTEAGLSARMEPRRLRGNGPGAGLFLFVEYDQVTAGFTVYGRKGLPSERVAEMACGELLAHHRATGAVDPHLVDQLVLPAVLAEGETRVSTARVTQHLLTNVWAVRQFLAREIQVEGELGSPGWLYVKGGRV